MTTKEVKTRLSEDLKYLCPELKKSSRYYKPIGSMLESNNIEIKLSNPFRCFKSPNNGKKYKVKIKNFTSKRVARVGLTKIEHFNNAIPQEYWNGIETGEYINERCTLRLSDIAIAISRTMSKNEETIQHYECGKCSGKGYLPHYAHIDDGICWDCFGLGSYHTIK